MKNQSQSSQSGSKKIDVVENTVYLSSSSDTEEDINEKERIMDKEIFEELKNAI